jgi:hypothetical protein
MVKEDGSVPLFGLTFLAAIKYKDGTVKKSYNSELFISKGKTYNPDFSAFIRLRVKYMMQPQN